MKKVGDSLEHRIGPEFVENGGVGHPEKPVDYMDNPVGGGDVGGDDGGIHAATFHSDSLVLPRSLYHVEVELLLISGGRHLQKFERNPVRKAFAVLRVTSHIELEERTDKKKDVILRTKKTHTESCTANGSILRRRV